MDNWTDIGIILKIEKRGEKGNLLNVLTNNHGRHMGWFNNFNKKQYLIQPGDLVSVSWSSRISNQLGFFKIELIETTVGKIFNDKIRLDIISSFCSLTSFILPERENCPFFFQKSKTFLKEIPINPSNNEVLKLYIFWELDLLNEVGTPLNFSECTISGDKKKDHPIAAARRSMRINGLIGLLLKTSLVWFKDESDGLATTFREVDNNLSQAIEIAESFKLFEGSRYE